MGVRCFISIDVNDPHLLTSFTKIQKSLEKAGADLKIVEAENMHITLMFLGDVEQRRLEELTNRIAETSFKPFSIGFKGVGTFPDLSRPRVIWVGISNGIEKLKLIYKELEEKIARMGFKLDNRGFSPHLTLARVRSGRNKDKLAELLREFENEFFGDMHVKHIQLKKSLLTSKGPIYSTITQSKSLED